MNNKIIRYYGAAFLAMFFWSFSFVWFKVAYQAYQPLTVILLRLTIAAILMLTFSALIKKLQRIKKEHIWWLVLLSFFEPFLYFMGESYGLTYLSPTVAAVIVATIPLFTSLAAWFFQKETLSWTSFAGLLISFFGVSLVVFDKTLGFSASPIGVTLEFIAVFSTIGYAVILKRLTDHYNGFTLVGYQNMFGALMFLPFWLIFESAGAIQTPFNVEAFSAIVKLAVFASLVAFILYTYCIRHLGINQSSMFVNIIPVFVAILSFFILKENLDTQKTIGIVIVISGLIIARKRESPKLMMAGPDLWTTVNRKFTIFAIMEKKGNNRIVIAIDGHSSCGKSTVAKELSKILGYLYLDSGAMYRAVTLFAMRNTLIENGLVNKQRLIELLKEIKIEFRPNPDTHQNDTYLNNENVEEEIRQLPVSEFVSTVATIAEVRHAMVQLQQEMGKHKGIVMDGRDIGTVVFPNAGLKIFMTAEPSVRARRRYDELRAKGVPVSYEEILKNVEERDYIDSQREVSPLKRADDALVLDNSFLSREEQLAWVLEQVKLRQDAKYD